MYIIHNNQNHTDGGISNGGTLNVFAAGNLTLQSPHTLARSSIYCPSNGICNIHCLIENACDFSKIYSSDGSIINIIANGSFSFPSSTISVANHTNLNLICDGYHSCHSVVVGM